MQSISTPRLVEFRRLCPAQLGWDMETECLRYDDSEVIFRATIKRPDGKVVATGHACEKRSVVDAFESCESKAISRALDNAGFTEKSVRGNEPQASQANERQEKSHSVMAVAADQKTIQAQEPAQKQEPGQEQEPNQARGKAQEQSPAKEPEKDRASQAVAGHEEKKEKKQDKPEEAKPTSNGSEPDEGKAEQWARENLVEWLDMPCPFAKAQGRTWRELAENQGAKIVMNGRSFPPRAYLHALENWSTCKMWQKIKARVALEVCKKESEIQAVS